MSNLPAAEIKSLLKQRLLHAPHSPGISSKSEYLRAVELVRENLDKVEQTILTQAQKFDPNIEEYVRYVCENGGKRLRPLLVLLSAGATGKISPAHLDLAVILEIIHVATLIHDDIIDGAKIRRGKLTAWAKWDHTTSVLLGDALFSHALRLSTHFDNSEICRKIADTSVDVCSGEILQTRRLFDTSLSLTEYFKIIELKTAALFATGCELSAKLNHSQTEISQNLHLFGLRLGLAYQAFDDCLDIAGSEPSAGKTLGTDLKKGKFTLPVLLYLQDNITNNSILNHLHEFSDGNSPELIKQFAKELREQGYLQKSCSVVHNLLEEAENCLKVLKKNPYTDGLLAVAAYIRGLSSELL
ncbi:MAG: polyprenyl synthetase family protein [Chthoniobacterales bacterium]|nr:polyprenyl synthetase family protein [Chthoniobacterales bacterium]